MSGKKIYEREVEEYMLNRIRKLKGGVRKVRWIGRRGAPDRFVWVPGWRFPKLVEVKAPGEEPKAHQWREINRLRSMNIEVLIIDSHYGVDEVFGVPLK